MNGNGNEPESFAGNFVASDESRLFFEVPGNEFNFFAYHYFYKIQVKTLRRSPRRPLSALPRSMRSKLYDKLNFHFIRECRRGRASPMALPALPLLRWAGNERTSLTDNVRKGFSNEAGARPLFTRPIRP
jgi:hypothetical protein